MEKRLGKPMLWRGRLLTSTSLSPMFSRQAAALRRTMWSQRLASSEFDFACLLVADQGERVVRF